MQFDDSRGGSTAAIRQGAWYVQHMGAVGGEQSYRAVLSRTQHKQSLAGTVRVGAKRVGGMGRRCAPACERQRRRRLAGPSRLVFRGRLMPAWAAHQRRG